MGHLPLQIQPQNVRRSTNERHRRIVRTTEIARFVECHRRPNVHVARVVHQRPTRRTFLIQNRFVVHLEWNVLDFKQQRIICGEAKLLISS